MKKGINAWCFPASYTLAQIFALAGECRFEGVELNLKETEKNQTGEIEEFSLGMSQTEWAGIQQLSQTYKMPIMGVSTALLWKYSLTDDDPSVREKGMRVVTEMLDAAAFWGCDAVLVVPGLVTEQVSYQTAYTRALVALKELRAYAEKKKVIIGIENVWNKFLLSPLEMAAFLDEIGSDYVRAYFDAGNVLQFSYPEHWVEVLGSRIAKVHIKDFDVSMGNGMGFKPLLQGDMRWGKLLNALREAGYDDYLTAELSPYRANPAQSVRDTSAAMDYIFSL